MAIHTCLVTYIYLVTCTVYVRPKLVVLVFVRPNSSYVPPKLKVIGQVKYLFAALITICSLNGNKCDILHSCIFTVLHFEEHYSTKLKCALLAYCSFIILLYLTAHKVIFH